MLPLLFTMVGCGGGSDSGSGGPGLTASPSPVASPTPNPGVVSGRVLTVYPNEGPASGGTAVSFRTQNIEYSTYPRYKVFFGNAEATDLNRSLPIGTGGDIVITCKTPPGSGTVRPVIRFYNEAGDTIGEFSPTEQLNRDFVYK